MRITKQYCICIRPDPPFCNLAQEAARSLNFKFTRLSLVFSACLPRCKWEELQSLRRSDFKSNDAIAGSATLPNKYKFDCKPYRRSPPVNPPVVQSRL